jgi:hypothetical protein
MMTQGAGINGIPPTPEAQGMSLPTGMTQEQIGGMNG